MPAEFFKDKVAIVTGASSGIGLETARLLDQRGARLVLAARRKEELERLAAGFREAVAVPTDVRDDRSVQELARRALERFGRIDILVNNAGALIYKPIADCSFAEVRDIMETNFFGAVRCVHAALPAMKKQGSGHIANVASIAGRVGFPNLGYYGASKFALVGLSETLRQELAPLGIFVTTVNPGTVETPMTEDILEKARAEGKNILPISPERVAAAILEAIEKKRPEVFVPFATRFLNALHFLFPGFAEWLAWKFRSSDPEAFRK